jgi:DNA-binding MarR family transcriptional regulator
MIARYKYRDAIDRIAFDRIPSSTTGTMMKDQAAEAFFLHFFTNVQLTSIAMHELGATGFSMTKNRILSFAALTPGLTVGELVKRLRVTPQNLNEPLRSLIDEGYVVARIGQEDRRHKQLFATPKGARQYHKVLKAQLLHIERAFDAAGPEAVKGFLEVHRYLVDSYDREWIEQASRLAEGTEIVRKSR